MTRTGIRFAAKLKEFADIAFSGDLAFQYRGKWRQFFEQRIGRKFNTHIVFEIGCSDGSYLTRIAAKHPGTAFIGIDWKCRSLCEAAQRVASVGLSNVVLLRGRAQDIRKIFGHHELNEVWVFHPDPCDRPVELKNRLIAEPFLTELHQLLKTDQSTLVLKTDHPGYYQWGLKLFGIAQPDHFATPDIQNRSIPRVRKRDLMSHADLPETSEKLQRQFTVTMHSTNYWHDSAALAHTATRLFSGEITAFENRFIKKRFPIYYIEIRKVV